MHGATRSTGGRHDQRVQSPTPHPRNRKLSYRCTILVIPPVVSVFLQRFFTVHTLPHRQHRHYVASQLAQSTSPRRRRCVAPLSPLCRSVAAAKGTRAAFRGPRSSPYGVSEPLSRLRSAAAIWRDSGKQKRIKPAPTRGEAMRRYTALSSSLTHTRDDGR